MNHGHATQVKILVIIGLLVKHFKWFIIRPIYNGLVMKLESEKLILLNHYWGFETNSDKWIIPQI